MLTSIVTPDTSNNSLARAFWLAKLVSHAGHRVEIVGAQFGPTLWAPLEDQRLVAMRSFPVNHRFSRFARSLPKLMRAIRGDVVWAVKPLTSSFLPAVLSEMFRLRPLLLDVDDWEIGFLRFFGATGFSRGGVRRALHEPNSVLSTQLLDHAIGFASRVTVSNTFLQKKYGGVLIPHGRDETECKINPTGVMSVRKRLGLTSEDNVIMFLGSPRPWKGLEDLVEAFRKTQVRKMCARLVIVGLDADKYSESIRILCRQRLADGTYFLCPMCHFSEMPDYVGASDVVVIPQRSSHATIGQMPAKVYDAMAMARPIISTRVSDIPVALEGCGWIVEPSDPEALAGALQEVVSNREKAICKGMLARKRFLEKYSLSAVSRQVGTLLSSLS